MHVFKQRQAASTFENVRVFRCMLGSGGRTVRGAVLIPEGRQFESPNRHVKITTAEVPLSKALNPYHELCSMKYAGPGCKQVSRYLVQFTLGNQRTLLCFALPVFTAMTSGQILF